MGLGCRCCCGNALLRRQSPISYGMVSEAQPSPGANAELVSRAEPRMEASVS